MKQIIHVASELMNYTFNNKLIKKFFFFFFVFNKTEMYFNIIKVKQLNAYSELW